MLSYLLTAIHCTLHCSKPPPATKTVTYRKIKGIDHTKFCNDIKSSKLLNDPPTDINNLVSCYNKTLGDLFDAHAPLKSRSFVERPLVPWMTDEILDAKRDRKKSEKRWQKTHLEIHLQLYQEDRNIVRKLINQAKVSFYQGKVQECAGDQGKLFKFTETLLKNSKVSSLPEHTSLHELTSRFNNFFMNKISTIHSKLEASDAGEMAVCVQSPFSGDRMTHFELASTSEISKIIKASKKATCSLDPVPTNLLADHYLDTLLPTLTNLVNRSLMTGTFPEGLKHALVRPLLKKPSLDANILNNFRPVSNLAFISNVIERAVASRLYDHMSANNLRPSSSPQ